MKTRLRFLDEQDRPVPRAWREAFDGLRPIRPIVYRKPTLGRLDAVGKAA